MFREISHRMSGRTALVLAGVLLLLVWAAAVQAAWWGGFTPRAWELVKKGGYTMIPLGVCSVVALMVVMERLLALRREKILPEDLIVASRDHWLRGDYEAAARLCARFDAPLARVLQAGLARRRMGLGEMERAMIGAGQHESTVLSRNLRALGVIANLAPMLGLFGTVVGMIRAFDVISRVGTGNPNLVAEGISEALFTTAAGLLIGIPALAAYHFFRSRGGRFLFEIEEVALSLLQHLAERADDASDAQKPASEDA